jgi:hypothetical protein
LWDEKVDFTFDRFRRRGFCSCYCDDAGGGVGMPADCHGRVHLSVGAMPRSIVGRGHIYCRYIDLILTGD